MVDVLLMQGLLKAIPDDTALLIYVPLDIAMDIARRHVQPGVRRKWLV